MFWSSRRTGNQFLEDPEKLRKLMDELFKR
jgi:hypothetical protein